MRPLALCLVLLVPALARGDGLTPLYQRIARDLQRGLPLVATVHVALCDNDLIRCGGRGLGDGDKPARNLYWGAAGLRAYFNRARGWKRIQLDEGDGEVLLERVLYQKRVSPSAAWRARGVSKPFELLLVGLAYRGSKIGTAMATFGREVASSEGPELLLADGRKIAYGGKGHVVGYAGHNYLLDVAMLGDAPWPRVTRDEPLAYFALACLTASYVGTHLCNQSEATPRALLVTETLMFPGPFIVEGLLEGLAAGEGQHAVYMRGVKRYAEAQRRPLSTIRAAFTHDADPRFIRRYGRCGVPQPEGASP